jgi:precorrin-4 methylase
MDSNGSAFSLVTNVLTREEPIMTNDRKDTSPVRKGKLTIVGAGITAVSHLTLEAVGCIKEADVIFYHATSGVMATHIRSLNPNVVDLYKYYDEGKIRTATYVQMAELMLREVRRGLSVVGVFHGHPGYFVKPVRRSMAIAEMEGYRTRLLPGISSTDCLFADLRIDPGVIGVQIVKASRILRRNPSIVTEEHLVLVQIGAVGDNTFSFSGYKRSKSDRLFEKLISIYGASQDSVYYMAPIFPGSDPTIIVRTIGEYRDPVARKQIHSGTLYLPPKGIDYSSLKYAQAFDGEPYGEFELQAISELDVHTTPATFKDRRASAAVLRAMIEVGTQPSSREEYRESPEKFVERHAELSREERVALQTRSVNRIRSVTTLKKF